MSTHSLSLEKAGAEILDYHGCGQSVMEMSHRSKVFDDIIKNAEKLMRELYNIPDNYKVLFLQGGASAQFSAIPLNFVTGSGKADYIITGQWAKKAFQEAQKYGDAKAVASSADKTFTYIPETKAEDFREDADYVYICMNNTIYGTKYRELPPVGDKVLIADVSSCALSEPLDRAGRPERIWPSAGPHLEAEARHRRSSLYRLHRRAVRQRHCQIGRASCRERV